MSEERVRALANEFLAELDKIPCGDPLHDVRWCGSCDLISRGYEDAYETVGKFLIRVERETAQRCAEIADVVERRSVRQGVMSSGAAAVAREIRREFNL